MEAVPPPPPTGPSVPRYAAGVVVTVAVIASQYFLPELVPALVPVYSSLYADIALVYGVPVLAFLLLVGTGPLRHWSQRMGVATVQGLAWFGSLQVLGIVVVIILTAIYLAVDPSALSLLSRQNPALTQATGNPWFYVALSFAIGAVEEAIFRGWIFGFWAARAGSWAVPAVWTSILFAGVHLYYGTTYGVVAPLLFPTLFLTGLAFAATFRSSGGNLVVVALLHGVYDASAFLTLVNQDAGLALRYLTILLGALVALVLWVRRSPEPPLRRI
jgi:membrane protease YdiL (CAAX protease family)